MKNIVIKLILIFASFTIFFFGYKLIGSLYFLQKSQEITQGVSLFDIDYNTLDLENIKEAENFILKSKALFQFKQTELELARIKYLEDNFEESYSIYVNNVLPGSNNPLYFLETGIVLINICEKDEISLSECFLKDPNLQKKIQGLVNIEELSRSAYDFFKQGNLKRTEEILLLRNVLTNEFNQKDKNLLLLSMIKNNKEIKQNELAIQNFENEDKKINIQPDDMIWLDGSEINIRTDENGKKIGKLWISDYVFSIFNINEAAKYRISINAIDSPPAPTKLEITINMNQIINIVLEYGDNDWSMKNEIVTLNKGLNFLTLRLMNDDIVDSVDRNGNIGGIYFEKIEN